MTASANARICQICGLDCSTRPRVRDAKGRYYCRACVEARRAAAAASSPAEPPRVEMLDEVLAARMSPCPECDQPMHPDAVVCAKCGYHLHLGRKLPTRISQDPSRLADEQREQFERRRKQERDQIRREYIKPLAMLGVGAGLIAVLATSLEGPRQAQLYLASYLVTVPIGVAVFYFCSWLWIGFDAPLGLTVVRLAGIYAVADVASIALACIPIGGWLLPLLIYIGLLMEMLDLDLTDAVMLAGFTFIAKVAIAAAVLMAAGG